MAIVSTSQGLFAILGQSNLEKISHVLRETYPTEHYPLAHGQWLLAAPGKTTKEISEQLGFSADPSIASAIVIAFTNYYGRANPQIWEWIATRLAAQRG
jgi:hypothetical protein